MNADEPVFATISNNALECNLYSYCENNPVNYFDPSGFKRWLINVKINKASIFTVDLVIVALTALLTCFAAVKLKYSALKIISWYNKNSIIKKLKALLVKLANLIVGAIHTVIYAISDTVPQWALRLSAISIAKVLIDFIELSPAEILLNILDRFDGDGKSGYIRYAMI